MRIMRVRPVMMRHAPPMDPAGLWSAALRMTTANPAVRIPAAVAATILLRAVGPMHTPRLLRLRCAVSGVGVLNEFFDYGEEGEPSHVVADSQSFRRSEEHTSELQSRENLVCRLLLEKKNRN